MATQNEEVHKTKTENLLHKLSIMLSHKYTTFTDYIKKKLSILFLRLAKSKVYPK